MAFDNYKYSAGLSNVGSYQVSGKPFLSGAFNVTKGGGVYKVDFPAVTKWIHISSSGHLLFGMSEAGVDADNDGENFFTVNTAGGQNLPVLDIKCTELYLSSSVATSVVSVMAGLTGIPNVRLDNVSPSGSNWSGSSGIG
tara:strand:- start:2216 stop:2635 length:420 start_codon:yes stop_codon:yes gene_type:complete